MIIMATTELEFLCQICAANADFYILMWVRDQKAFSSCLLSLAESSVCSCCHDLHYSNDPLSDNVLGQWNNNATNCKALTPNWQMLESC